MIETYEGIDSAVAKVWISLIEGLTQYDPSMRSYLQHWVQQELAKLPRDAMAGYQHASVGLEALEAEEQSAMFALLQSLRRALMTQFTEGVHPGDRRSPPASRLSLVPSDTKL
ncbi:hypothetical protein ACYJW8_04125 [Frateuria aurantia]